MFGWKQKLWEEFYVKITFTTTTTITSFNIYHQTTKAVASNYCSCVLPSGNKDFLFIQLSEQNLFAFFLKQTEMAHCCFYKFMLYFILMIQNYPKGFRHIFKDSSHQHFVVSNSWLLINCLQVNCAVFLFMWDILMDKLIPLNKEKWTNIRRDN